MKNRHGNGKAERIRPRGNPVFPVNQLWLPGWLGVLSPVLILLWGVYAVRQFLERGLLNPDFGVILEAYQFGFRTFPLVLIVAGFLGSLLGCFKSTLAGRLAWWAPHGGCLFLAFALLGLKHYVTEVEPSRLVLHEFEMESPHVSLPLRILHISDIQSAGVGEFERAVFERIKDLEPDMIIHSGDWLQPIPPNTYDSEFPKLMKLIRRLNPPLGIYGVYGDTDAYWYGKSGRELGKLTMMGPRPYLIEWSGGLIALRGLGLFQSHHSGMARRPVIDWLKSVPEDSFTLLVGHAPDYALEVNDLPIELCLAGHTHGGQVRIPRVGPLIIDSKVPLEWARGNRRVNRIRLNVSAGLGSTHAGGLPSIRLHCPPEMTLITVMPR